MAELIGYNPEEEKNIKLNPAEMEPLTAYDEEFLIPIVREGQDVLVGRSLADGDFYLRCDFSSFAEKLQPVTPEKLEELFTAVDKLEKQAPNLGEDERRLLNTCWRAARITKNLLGDVGSEHKRNESFSEYAMTTPEGKKACIKPLSKCVGQAVCSEYALMAQHILNLVGIKSSVIVGAFSENVEDPLAGRHTFIALEDGKYVFDPTHTAQQKDGWPPLETKSSNTLNIEMRMSGRTIQTSLSPK